MAITNLTLSDVITPATQQQWLTTILGAATTLNLPATSWQSGGIARTILAVMSYGLSFEDALITAAAQGGFLDFAATGTAQVTNPITGVVTTVPVTPDPSIPSQWPSPNTPPPPGWLDILADGRYNVQRIQATSATGTLAITNSTANAYGPFAPLTYHVASSNGATYSNASTLTIAAASIVGGSVTGANFNTPIVITTSAPHGIASGQTVTVSGVTGNLGANGTFLVGNVTANTITLLGSTATGAYSGGGTVNVPTLATIVADVAGTAGTSGPGAITQPVSSLIGVSIYNVAGLVGSNYESNVALAARCQLKLQSLSPNGPAGAYRYFALSSSNFLPATVSQLSGGTITRAIVSALNGVVTTTVANAAGPVSGFSGVLVSAAANNGSGLIRLTVNANIPTGTLVLVSGVVGTVPANGTWTVNNVNSTQIDLQNSQFSGTYVSGGVVEAGDLGIVDYVIQSNVVPNGTTAITQSATSTTILVTGNVYVPSAQVTNFTNALSTALTNYQATLPIGGSNVNGSQVVSFDDVIGVVYAAGITAFGGQSYVIGITGFALNGATIDVPIASTSVAVFANLLSIVGQ